jgi:hypothetical protein
MYGANGGKMAPRQIQIDLLKGRPESGQARWIRLVELAISTNTMFVVVVCAKFWNTQKATHPRNARQNGRKLLTSM